MMSPEPFHWRSGSDEPEKPTISTYSKKRKWKVVEDRKSVELEKWVEPTPIKSPWNLLQNNPFDQASALSKIA